MERNAYVLQKRAERVELAGSYDDILRQGRGRSARFVAFYRDQLPEVSPDFPARLNPADLECAKTFPVPSSSVPNQRHHVYRLRPK